MSRMFHNFCWSVALAILIQVTTGLNLTNWRWWVLIIGVDILALIDPPED